MINIKSKVKGDKAYKKTYYIIKNSMDISCKLFQTGSDHPCSVMIRTTISLTRHEKVSYFKLLNRNLRPVFITASQQRKNRYLASAGKFPVSRLAGRC